MCVRETVFGLPRLKGSEEYGRERTPTLRILHKGLSSKAILYLRFAGGSYTFHLFPCLPGPAYLCEGHRGAGWAQRWERQSRLLAVAWRGDRAHHIQLRFIAAGGEPSPRASAASARPAARSTDACERKSEPRCRDQFSSSAASGPDLRHFLVRKPFGARNSSCIAGVWSKPKGQTGGVTREAGGQCHRRDHDR